MNDEQLEQIATETVIELINDGKVVDGRWDRSKVYTRPDNAMIRAILKAAENVKQKVMVEDSAGYMEDL